MENKNKVHKTTIELDNDDGTKIEFSEGTTGDIPKAIIISNKNADEILLDDELIDIIKEGMEEMGWLDE